MLLTGTSLAQVRLLALALWRSTAGALDERAAAHQDVRVIFNESSDIYVTRNEEKKKKNERRGEADEPCYELNLLLAARPRCDVAAPESRVLWKEFAIWNDVKMSQTASITPGPASALQRRK